MDMHYRHSATICIRNFRQALLMHYIQALPGAFLPKIIIIISSYRQTRYGHSYVIPDSRVKILIWTESSSVFLMEDLRIVKLNYLRLAIFILCHRMIIALIISWCAGVKYVFWGCLDSASW